jgi:small GTP-binding protein
VDLHEYEHAKFRLAEILRSSGASSSQLPQELQNRVRELFSRLAEDRFNLVVVGRFSRGKTSLMNAVLGSDRLPRGIRPLTSVITTVSYGSSEKAIIHYAGSSLPQEVRLAELAQYITEKGNSRNQRNVRIAAVQLPVELLRRGFYFVDTPGLGSPIVENTRTTERFLPEADAFVLVTSFEGPLSDEEVRFLRTARASGKAVFVVVNKLDLATKTEREEVLRYLRGLLDGQHLGIFALSARDALAAKRQSNLPLLAASGLPAFESDLVRFLLNEKSREFVLGMCQRVGRLLADLPGLVASEQLAQRVGEIARQVGGDRGASLATASEATSRRRPYRRITARARFAATSSTIASTFCAGSNTRSRSIRSARSNWSIAAVCAAFIPGSTSNWRRPRAPVWDMRACWTVGHRSCWRPLPRQ